MRKMKKPPAEELRKKKEEPLAEGLQVTVPTDSCGRRLWSKMSDEQIVEFARKAIEEKRISRRNELKNTNSGLYEILRKKGLLDDVGFGEKVRSWKDMSDDEIVEFVRKLMDKKKISGRYELQKVNSRVYSVLQRRGLLDDVGFVTKLRSWDGIGDEEIVAHAKKVMIEKRIFGRSDLSDADRGLHAILRERGLLDEVGFEDKRKKERSWKSMSDDEIVEFAKAVIKKNKITNKNELRKVDRGLSSVLRRRRLLDHAFAQIEQQKTDQARDAVIDALEAFAANDNASAEDDVA